MGINRTKTLVFLCMYIDEPLDCFDKGSLGLFVIHQNNYKTLTAKFGFVLIDKGLLGSFVTYQKNW